jgi:hypothetical protein
MKIVTHSSFFFFTIGDYLAFAHPRHKPNAHVSDIGNIATWIALEPCLPVDVYVSFFTVCFRNTSHLKPFLSIFHWGATCGNA